MGDATNIFEQAAGDILDEMTDEVDASFIPLAGAPCTARVYLNTEAFNEPGSYETRAVGTQRLILARLSDLPDVPVAKTQATAGDKFVISSVEYEVVEITENDGTFVECKVKII